MDFEAEGKEVVEMIGVKKTGATISASPSERI
jgi:hypothetical protein